MRIGYRLPVAIFALLAFSAEPAPAHPAPLPPALRGEVESVLQASAVRGAAVVLVDATGPTHALWYGLADAARGAPITAQTCMRAGSVSQTFTAMLAMRLADQGKLSLDDPLPADLQPAMARPTAHAGAACGGRVTVAQLLEHTAGVTASQAVDRRLAWCPGLHYSESDDGIALAAAALERAGGADFDTMMRREVFAPLGLSGARDATDATPACLSRSYGADGRDMGPPRQPPTRAANALAVTPLDLARVVQMLLRYGDSPAGHVLEPCSIAHMAAGTTGLAGRHGAVAGARGKGLTRFVAADRLMIGQTSHSGHIDGFQTLFGFATETGRGMVIMLNTADEATMHRLREATAAHLWRDVPAPPLPPLARPAEGIDGWYVRAGDDGAGAAPWSSLRDIVRIETEPSGLGLRPLWPWGETRHVLAVTETSFRDEALPMASMAFVREHGGRRWWIAGASHVEVHPLAVTAVLAALAALAAGLSAVLVALLFRLRRVVAECIERGAVSVFASASGRSWRRPRRERCCGVP